MAFKFRMETLLVMRQRKQEIEEGKLSRVLLRLRNCREAMEILQNRLSGARKRLAEKIARGMPAGEFLAESQNIMGLEARLEEFRKEETSLRMESNRVRHDLKVAHRERELVEKLKDRNYQAWRYEMQRQEQKEADDLSTMKYIRQRQ
jgi:flagellar FliJ protein